MPAPTYPSNVATVTVTGNWGSDATGLVTFTPSAILSDGTSTPPQFVMPERRTAVLTGGGITVELMATDDSHLSPSGWLWVVTEQIVGQPTRMYYLQLPAAVPSIDLTAATKPTTPGALVAYVDAAAVGAVNGVVSAATLTTKGDLYVATAEGTVTREGVGTDGQVLTADSTSATGVRWESPAAGGVTSVNGHTGTVTLAASDVGAVATSTVGADSGVASLDAGGQVPAAQLGNAPVQSVAGKTGAVTLAEGDINNLTADLANRTVYRGAWAPSTAYNVNDLATYADTLLLCKTAHTSGSSFAGLGNWTPLNQPAHVFNVRLYGAKGDGATDDTAAINAAVSAATTWATSTTSTYYAEVYFPPGQYLLSSPTTKTATNKGNAQIPLPLLATTGQKLTLVFRGGREAAAIPHWQQTTAQRSGAVLVSTLTGQVPDGTFGAPSVIGGPTPAQGYGQSAGLFNNILPVIDNLAVSVPANPTVMAIDFSGCAQAHLINPGINASTAPGTAEPATPTNNWAIGVYMPQTRNNDLCIIENPSIEGMYVGVIASEHTAIRGGRIVYCHTGVDCLDGGDVITIDSTSIEVCTWVLTAENISGGGSPRASIWARIEVEQEASGNFAAVDQVHDPGNIFEGTIELHVQASNGVNETDPVVTGGDHVRILRMDRRPGNVAAPSMPASTVALKNPFWRDAVVTVTGGTVSAVSVDGVAQGYTATGFTVIVPSGRTITLTYSAAPTWVWTLL